MATIGERLLGMLDRPSAILASDDEIRADFQTFKSNGSRCTKCHRMQMRETPMAWVCDSSDFFNVDGYDRLAVTSAEASHMSGWCFPCVAKTKLIADDFRKPEGWRRKRRWSDSPEEALALAREG